MKKSLIQLAAGIVVLALACYLVLVVNNPADSQNYSWALGALFFPVRVTAIVLLIFGFGGIYRALKARRARSRSVRH